MADNNQFHFKKFVGLGSRSGDYFISFNKSGFLLSAGFYSKEGIKNFSKVILYFDEIKKALGLKFTTEDNAEGAFKLVHANNGTTGSFSAVSFVKKFKLTSLESYGRKTPKKIQYEGVGELFVIDLNKIVV